MSGFDRIIKMQQDRAFFAASVIMRQWVAANSASETIKLYGQHYPISTVVEALISKVSKTK